MRRPNVARALDDLEGPVQLFHGTTRSRAEAIRHEGFRCVEQCTEIDRIAGRYGIPAVDLRADLERHQRFLASRSGDRNVYFTTGRAHAASYATRAPEAEWECLWAVYRHMHPQLGAEWNQSDEGHFWVLRQQEGDSPVVLVVDVDDTVIPQGLAKIFPPDDPDNGYEVRVEPASINWEVSRLEPCDRRLDGSLLRFVTGLSADALAVEVVNGVWPASGHYRGERYWEWLDVKNRLNPQRLFELYS